MPVADSLNGSSGYAGLAGALVGTIVGEAALPADMLGQVLESNRSVYGIDLEEVAHRLAQVDRD